MNWLTYVIMIVSFLMLTVCALRSEYVINANYLKNAYDEKNVLGDEIWEKSKVALLSRYDGKKAPEGLVTKIRALWNETYLYLRFDGKFDSLRVAPEDAKKDKWGQTYQLWDLSDVYEFFIGKDAGKTKKYYEFQGAPDERRINLKIDLSGGEFKSQMDWDSGLKVVSKIDEERKGWTSVFILPFKELSHQPKKNDVWDINFYRISGEGKDKVFMSWTFMDKLNFHQPERFGKIKFN